MTQNIIARRCCVIAQQGVDYRDVIVARQATGAHFKDDQVMAWGSHIALGLAHLHDECKLVHQDLHNGNVMITGLCNDEEGGVLDVDNDVLLATTSVKILDLGLASFKSDHSRTASERTMRMGFNMASWMCPRSSVDALYARS